jgi:37-kD nucleoid-associated bacterial protein
MQSDLALLEINKVILHDIPKHTKQDEGDGPVLSEVESPLSARSSYLFKTKIIESIGSPKAFGITFDATSASPVPGLITTSLADSRNSVFIRNSQEIAKHLYNIQSGQNPSGLLAVIDCVIDGKRGLAIVKLEREEGVRLQQTKIKEKRTYDLHLISDLIFTQKTKVYKVSLFIGLDGEATTIEAAASDHQTGYFKQADVARFFLSSFLGCTLLEAANISTRNFYELSERYFNEEVDDPIKRSRYYNHLRSALTAQHDSLSPESFAVSYLETPDRKPYVDYIQSQGLTAKSFPLDTGLIDRRLKSQIYHFREGVSITIDSDGAEDRVKWTPLPSGEVKAEIHGILKEIKGKG